MATPTIQSIIKMMPEDVVELVGRILGDSDIDQSLDDVKMMLPASPVIETINGYIGLTKDVPQHQLDQAEAWITEQVKWQDRAMAAQKVFTEKQPFSETQADKGEIPQWMGAPWAEKLLFIWADGLRDAVINAEEYAKTL